MSVLSEYYEALGGIITNHAATLTSFSGDGLMVLVNAPVAVEEPALRAVDMALGMQRSVQQLIAVWRDSGYGVGFGIGLAMGPATVGRIGYESRFDREILMDFKVAEAIRGKRPLIPLGPRPIKGYDEDLPVFGISFDGRPATA